MMLTQYFEDLGLFDLVVVAGRRPREAEQEVRVEDRRRASPSSTRSARRSRQQIGYVIGDVRGKTAIIVDDGDYAAGTLKAAAQTVLDEGAARVYAAATHPVLSGNAYENLASSGFEQVVVTDTIPLRAGRPYIRVLSCADLLTDSIRRIFTDDSVSEVFGGENQPLLAAAGDLTRSASHRR